MYVLKDQNTVQFICFDQKKDRIQNRTLKQKLADISTSYLINQFNDDTYSEFFKYYYIPMNAFMISYARMRKLRIPEDLCFFYKGGNLFRMLLGDITRIMESKEYIALLKRSDADFQLFINPKIKDYDKILKEISIIVIYNLMLFKKTIEKKGIMDFFKINKDELCNLYKQEFENNGFSIKSIELADRAYRKDFSIEPANYNGENIVLYRTHNSLLENAPNVTVLKDFFISRNTALSFKRKDDLKSVFDLIRLKRNIRIKIVTNSNEKFEISVPCEIIDVSIPKNDDYGMNSFRTKVNGFIRQYTLESKSITFWAPNINYMIKDLDDVLFKQADYPWMDLKIDKRVTRYFISLLFHQIMVSILDKKDLVERLNIFKKELSGTVRFLQCYIAKSACDFGEGSMSRLLYAKYEKLSKRINKIKDKQEQIKELERFREFNHKIMIVLKHLVGELDKLIANSGKINQKKMIDIYNKLIVNNLTKAL
jgi:hypothetical protein